MHFVIPLLSFPFPLGKERKKRFFDETNPLWSISDKVVRSSYFKYFLIENNLSEEKSLARRERSLQEKRERIEKAKYGFSPLSFTLTFFRAAAEIIPGH